MIHAVTFFIVPTVGAIALRWFWRRQRARARSQDGESMRETSRELPRELPLERARDENWRAF
jgi:hypothetical protein